jgi:hypothetical protein
LEGAPKEDKSNAYAREKTLELRPDPIGGGSPGKTAEKKFNSFAVAEPVES